MSEAPFQTNMHLSLKERIKRETQYRIKASNHLFTEQKNRKKKKKEAKTLQTTRVYQLKKKKKQKETQYYFKKNSHSFREQKKPKKKKKKEAKTLNPKTSSLIKIHIHSA